jgi:hypothetical protein
MIRNSLILGVGVEGTIKFAAVFKNPDVVPFSEQSQSSPHLHQFLEQSIGVLR